MEFGIVDEFCPVLGVGRIAIKGERHVTFHLNTGRGIRRDRDVLVFTNEKLKERIPPRIPNIGDTIAFERVPGKATQIALLWGFANEIESREPARIVVPGISWLLREDWQTAEKPTGILEPHFHRFMN